MAEVAEQRQWQYHYYSLVVWLGMKLYFTVVGQAQGGGGHLLVPTHVHSGRLYSAASPGNQAAHTPVIPLSHIILTLSQPVLTIT